MKKIRKELQMDLNAIQLDEFTRQKFRKETLINFSGILPGEELV